MTTEPTGARSRRALLAGALGGLAGLAAGSLGFPRKAEAAAGSPLIIGSEANNAGTANTQLLANSNVVTFKLYQQGPGTALMGYTTPTTGATRGVYGRVDSPDGDGVQARNAGAAGTGAAVRAFGGQNNGLMATTNNGARAAVWAEQSGVADSACAIYGIVTSVDPGAGSAAVRGENKAAVDPEINGMGVHGIDAGYGAGVRGDSPLGAGVSGGSSDGTGVHGGSQNGTGVYGESSNGTGVYGESSTGYAGYFVGKVAAQGHLDITEIAVPDSPAAATARLFARDDGSGKTQLCVLFPSGAVQVLATEP